MKAIIVSEFGEPDVLKFEETADLKPNESQILVKIEAAGVNPVDAYVRSGKYTKLPDLPYTPGKDAAGIVEKAGAKITKFKAGDRVLTADSLTGTYAEFCLCEEKHLIKLPDNVSYKQGAGVFIPYATAYRALIQKAKAQSRETVLIHGASGGVGTAAIQWAKNANLNVIGTASSDEGRKLIIEQGADYVFDHSKNGYLDEINKATNGKGVNIILEMLANVNLTKDFEVLAMFGRISVIGNRGSLDFNPRLAMTKDATIYGLSLFNAPASEMSEIHESIYDGLADGFLNPHVGKTFDLKDAAKAQREVIEGKALGKIILQI